MLWAKNGEKTAIINVLQVVARLTSNACFCNFVNDSPLWLLCLKFFPKTLILAMEQMIVITKIALFRILAHYDLEEF